MPGQGVCANILISIGSSFIGMEVANAIAKGNDVTVVGMEKAPLERIMVSTILCPSFGNLESKMLSKLRPSECKRAIADIPIFTG